MSREELDVGILLTFVLMLAAFMAPAVEKSFSLP
jgi:hypothetical protein